MGNEMIERQRRRHAVNQKICYIVGAMSLTPDLRPYPTSGDYVIAADRGFDSLVAYGVNPDLAVGDFDSLGHRPNHPNVIQLPAEKDDTDMVYAIRKGLELGYRRFILLGGVGGRLEHTRGNLQLLDWLTLHGAQGFLAGEKTVATCLRDGKKITFPAAMEGYLSVFCNSGTAEGVNLSGLKFPLENHTLTGSFPLGVSNQFLGEPAVVSVEKGSLLLIWEDRGSFYAKLPKLWAE